MTSYSEVVSENSWDYDKRSNEALVNFQNIVRTHIGDSSAQKNDFQKLFIADERIDDAKDSDVIMWDDSSDSDAEGTIDELDASSDVEITSEAENAAEIIIKEIEANVLDKNYFQQIIDNETFAAVCQILAKVSSALIASKFVNYFTDNIDNKSVNQVKILLSKFLLPYIRVHSNSRWLNSVMNTFIQKYPSQVITHLLIPLIASKDNYGTIVGDIVSKLKINWKLMLINMIITMTNVTLQPWMLPILRILIEATYKHGIDEKRLIDFLLRLSKTFNENIQYKKIVQFVSDNLPKYNLKSILNSNFGASKL